MRNFDNKTSGFFFFQFLLAGLRSVPSSPAVLIGLCNATQHQSNIVISNKVIHPLIPTPQVPHHFFSLLFFRLTLCGLFFLALALLYYLSAT